MTFPSEDLIIPSFSEIIFLNHRHLRDIFEVNQEFFKFLTDQLPFEKTPKRILFTIIYHENRKLYENLKMSYNQLKTMKFMPSIKGCSITVIEDMFNFLFSLPDVENETLKKRINFVKRKKVVGDLEGINQEQEGNKLRQGFEGLNVEEFDS